MEQAKKRRGLVCTFYSYKGGVGRSMALANVSAMLARLGQRVLIIDWDLEAPGLERFFGSRVRPTRLDRPGLVDFIAAFGRGEPIDWRDCRLQVSIPEGETIDFIHAGREGDSYLKQLRKIDWYALFEQKDLGRFLDGVRSEWKNEYDYILLDSRTGITDVGGICSILLPDYLVSFFTTNIQSVLGVKETTLRAREAQKELPLNRQRLVVIPIPARDESNTEYQRALEWRRRFALELSEFYHDWIPKDETAETVLDYLKIPYVAFWSFGEQLPVLDEDATNPKTLAYSYALIARLIHFRLDWSKVKEGREANELQAKKAEEMQTRLAEANKARAEALVQQQKEAERQLEERRKIVMARFNFLTEQIKASMTFDTRMFLLCLGGALAVGYGGVFYGLWTPQKMQSPLFWLGIVTIYLGAAGAIRLYFRRRRHVHRRENLLRELTAYQVGRGAYARLSSEGALLHFADQIERIADNLLPSTPGEASATSDISPVPPTPVPPPGSRPPAVKTSVPLSPPQGAAGPPGAAPPPAVRVPSHIDVLVTYPTAGISRDWVLEFAPLFTRWLGEMLGREAVIVDATVTAPGEDWPALFKQRSEIARTAVSIVSPRYLQSDWGRAEIEMLLRTLTPKRVFPIRLEAWSSATRGEPAPLVAEIGHMQIVDFSDLAYVGEAFTKSERYIEFQDRIRHLAARVGETIQQAEREAAPARAAGPVPA